MFYDVCLHSRDYAELNWMDAAATIHDCLNAANDDYNDARRTDDGSFNLIL